MVMSEPAFVLRVDELLSCKIIYGAGGPAFVESWLFR